MTHVQYVAGLGFAGTAVVAIVLSSFVPLSRGPQDSQPDRISNRPAKNAENGAARLVAQSAMLSRKPFFMGLGDLPESAFASIAKGISADGLVIVGCSNSNVGLEAIRWTPDAGLVGFGRHLDSSDIFANAVSADGTTVVGSITFPTGAEAFRWTSKEGLVLLGKLPGRTLSIARAVSGDGSMVVGQSDSDAFRWTADEGMVRLGGFPDGYSHCVANDITKDGSVIVGSCRNPALHTVAFRWKEPLGCEILENTINDGKFVISAVSADGTILAGTAGNEAFRWTAYGGAVALGNLPGGNSHSYVGDISGDGSVIVGSSEVAGGIQAFVWDSDHGMRAVREMLEEDLSVSKELVGWKLTNAACVSADGGVIAGIGWNPRSNLEAWVASLGD